MQDEIKWGPDLMRLILASLAFAAFSCATPASAQTPRNFAMMGGMAEGKYLLMLVSEAMPNTDRPYDAIVSYGATPDRYWYLSFAFDCNTRTMSARGIAARDWFNNVNVPSAPPANGNYDHALESFAARVICDRDRSNGGFATFQSAIKGAYTMTTGKEM